MPGDWRGPSMPGQLPLRVAILGGIGIVAFAIVFLRLWYLEVLSGDKYLAQAQNNQVREFTVQAPRGKVVDRHGNVLVENRTALALQVKPLELPTRKARRADLFGRLEELSGPAAEADPQRDPRGAEAVLRLPGDAAPRRPLRHRLLPAREPGPLPRRLGRARVRAPLSAGADRRAPARVRGRGLDRRPRGARRYEGAAAGRPSSARTASSPPTTTSCAASTARPASRSTPRVSRPAACSPTREPTARQRPRALDRRQRPAGGRERRSRAWACRAASWR